MDLKTATLLHEQHVFEAMGDMGKGNILFDEDASELSDSTNSARSGVCGIWLARTPTDTHAHTRTPHIQSKGQDSRGMCLSGYGRIRVQWIRFHLL